MSRRRFLAATVLAGAALWAAACSGVRAPARSPADEEGALPAAGAGAAAPVETAPDTPPAAIPPATGPRLPERIRIGLATDLPRTEFSCCGGPLRAGDGRRVLAVSEPILVRPATAPSGSPLWVVQLAALKDEGQAQRLAAELAERLGVPVEAPFDAGTDLYRVRSRGQTGRAEAERLREAAVALGTSGAWVTQLGSAAAGDGFVLEQGGRSQAVAGRWLAIEAGSAGVVAYGGHRYRGRLLVYLNDRGLLNVINETALEDYLRGVVPRELGPEAFPELEALKAQAVAARTYTLRNLGEFTREGYDICATPRCQVYGGRDAEHPFSDRAVAETAGEVLLWEGELVDALYSSTCGGHTENAEVVFPLKQAPYLRGVACVEDGGQILPGRNDSRPLVTTVLDLLLPPAVGDARQRAAQRGRDLAEMAGLAVPPVELASLERRAVQRFAGALFDLAVDARLFLSDADLEYLVTSPPDDWSAEDRRLAAYLAHAGWLQPGPGTVLDSVAVDGLWFELARHLRILEERSVRVVDVVGDRLHTRDANGNVAEHPLDGDLVLYQRYGSQLEALPVRVLPGDRVELVFAGPRLLALIHPVVAGGAAFDRGSQRSRWEVFHSQAELAGQVAERYPGFQLSDFEVLERGVSGRVGALLLKGREGQEQRVEGLAVRWTLDLPDTWFSARRLDPPEGEAGWLFTGRGWGHGVGLCQVGAFGMARRGADYRAILLHYYSGVELVELTPVS